MRRLARALAWVLLASAAGCDAAMTPSAGQKGLAVIPDAPLPPFARSDPRLSVAHSGVRRLESALASGPGSLFREHIVTDGHGRYSIRPLASQDWAQGEWDAFELLQVAREGFVFRYRDFLVRDPQRFARNWKTTAVPGAAAVAGRSCQRYRVERVRGQPIVFELSVDEETGLVLASQELDENGLALSSMTYETFELDPDLGGVAWHVPSNQERVLASAATLADEIALRPLEPRLLPDGYGALEVATVEGERAGHWLKLTYSDGVEPLFFLQTLVEPAQGRAARMGGPDPDGRADSPSKVTLFRIGAALAIQGDVEGFHLAVIGKAPEAELLDMIESSLP